MDAGCFTANEIPLSIVGDLIESNLRQRVLGNTNPVKLGRCFIFLNKYYGFERGGNRSNQYKQKDHNGLFAKATLDEIAKELNMSKRNLQRALRIEHNLTDSMKELLDTGEIFHCIGSTWIAKIGMSKLRTSEN